MTAIPSGLNKRWYALEYHEKQAALFRTHARFVVVPAGRRSGKTEIAKRYLIDQAIAFDAFDDGRFIFAAPTIAQARQIYWNDLKKMTDIEGLRIGKPNESRMEVQLVNGAVIQVIGLDKPERAEGDPIDGIVLDEYGNMKKDVWDEHIRPGLDTRGREGWAWFIGVPEGRNHYYKLWKKAIKPKVSKSWLSSWAGYHWWSEDILSEEAIAAAKEDLDELTYKQEYQGEFVNFAGRAYYSYDPQIHSQVSIPYDPKAPLIVCFDFNVEPGIAVLAQEVPTVDRRGRLLKWCKDIPNIDKKGITGVVGEVWIKKNSNTPKVCKTIARNWKSHKGLVLCYGDATGGARHTSQTEGTDWDLIEEYLKPTFGPRLHLYNKRKNPPERVRVNAMNSRLKTADGVIHMLIDPYTAPKTEIDFDSVTSDEAGELDKKTDKTLTHLTDALGYYVEDEHSIADGEFKESDY